MTIGLRRRVIWAALGTVAMLTLTACATAGPKAATSSPSASPTQSASLTPIPTPTATPTATPTPTPNPLILAPATTASVVGICSEQMSYGADGNASPIICSNGAINVVAWDYLKPNAPALFAAGADASEAQVSTLVSKLVGPLPSSESEFCLVSAYYGWQFAINLDPATQAIPNASCSSDFLHWP